MSKYWVIFLLTFIFAGCSSKPSDKDILAAVYKYYDTDSCPTISFKIVQNNIIPKESGKHLKIDLNITYGLIGHTEDAISIVNDMNKKIKEKQQAELERYKKQGSACIACVELDLMSHRISLSNIEKTQQMRAADGIVNLYNKGCSNDAKGFQYRAASKMIKDGFPADVSIKENIVIDMVKSDNGWILDKYSSSK
jgi:hypothetical protein